jgi:hypothetical protein
MVDGGRLERWGSCCCWGVGLRRFVRVRHRRSSRDGIGKALARRRKRRTSRDSSRGQHRHAEVRRRRIRTRHRAGRSMSCVQRSSCRSRIRCPFTLHRSTTITGGKTIWTFQSSMFWPEPIFSCDHDESRRCWRRSPVHAEVATETRVKETRRMVLSDLFEIKGFVGARVFSRSLSLVFH